LPSVKGRCNVQKSFNSYNPFSDLFTPPITKYFPLSYYKKLHPALGIGHSFPINFNSYIYKNIIL